MPPSMKDKYIGENRIASNGMKIILIDYINSRNVTVKFEDETIVEKRTVQQFKDGNIKHPVIKGESRTIRKNKEKHINEKSKASNGQEMILVAYRSSKDVDVVFEDGNIETNKTYKNFVDGNIRISKKERINKDLKEVPRNKPNNKQEKEITKTHRMERINQREKNHDGQEMFIKEYRSSVDIDVEFVEDEVVVKNVTYDRFILGGIRNPNKKRHSPRNRVDRMGEVAINKMGERMKIIKYYNANNVDIKFADGTIVKNRIYRNFVAGSIRKPKIK